MAEQESGGGTFKGYVIRRLAPTRWSASTWGMNPDEIDIVAARAEIEQTVRLGWAVEVARHSSALPSCAALWLAGPVPNGRPGPAPRQVDAGADGAGTLTVRSSKTDQEGRGHVRYLGPPTIAAVQRWQQASAIVAGPCSEP